MSIAFSKVTPGSTTVIPAEVQEQLGLKPGDRIRYRILSNRVEIERDDTPAAEDPFVTFGEWSEAADEEAYASL